MSRSPWIPRLPRAGWPKGKPSARIGMTLPVEAHRGRLYREIRRGKTLGCKSWFLEGYADMSVNARLALEGLIADGWIVAHVHDRGDGSVDGIVYVATGKGRGVEP